MTRTTGKISVSQHAIDRAIQHFRVDRRVAEDWVRSQFRKAAFVSEILSEDGRPTLLYAFNRIAFAVGVTDNVIATVYPQNYAVTELATKVHRLISRELRKAEQTVRGVERRVSVAKAKLAVERAKCEYNMMITPSKAVIAANSLRLTEIDEELAKLDAELFGREKGEGGRSKIVSCVFVKRSFVSLIKRAGSESSLVGNAVLSPKDRG